MDADEGIAMDTDDDVSSAKKMKEMDGKQQGRAAFCVLKYFSCSLSNCRSARGIE